MKKSRAFRNFFQGTIVPSVSDSSGKFTGIALRTHENTYVVEHNRIGNELIKYIHHKVRVNGKMRQRLDGRILIRIAYFEVLTSPVEPAEENI